MIYGKNGYKSVDDLRYYILKQKCINLERNIDLSQFSPFSQHIRRVNYQAGIWKLTPIPKPHIPLTINRHVWTENNGKLVPVWCQGQIISIDIAEEDDTLESDDDVASSSEEEVMAFDSAVVVSDSDED